jgi:hypothetical protein
MMKGNLEFVLVLPSLLPNGQHGEAVFWLIGIIKFAPGNRDEIRTFGDVRASVSAIEKCAMIDPDKLAAANSDTIPASAAILVHGIGDIQILENDISGSAANEKAPGESGGFSDSDDGLV